MKNYRLCRDIIACVEELYDNSEIIVIISNTFVRYEPTIEHEKIYCSGQVLFPYQYNMISRFGSHLMPKIDEILLRLIEGGLFLKTRVFEIYEKGWLNTNVSALTKIKINDDSMPSKIEEKSNQIISLQLNHFAGAFMVFLIGHSVALFTFVAEVMVQRISTMYSNKFVSFSIFILDPR